MTDEHEQKIISIKRALDNTPAEERDMYQIATKLGLKVDDQFERDYNEANYRRLARVSFVTSDQTTNTQPNQPITLKHKQHPIRSPKPQEKKHSLKEDRVRLAYLIGVLVLVGGCLCLPGFYILSSSSPEEGTPFPTRYRTAATSALDAYKTATWTPLYLQPLRQTPAP